MKHKLCQLITHRSNVETRPGCSWMSDQPVALCQTNSAFTVVSAEVVLQFQTANVQKD